MRSYLDDRAVVDNIMNVLQRNRALRPIYQRILEQRAKINSNITYVEKLDILVSVHSLIDEAYEYLKNYIDVLIENQQAEDYDLETERLNLYIIVEREMNIVY